MWGRDQELLEKQALKELETFAEASKNNEDTLEDGEIVDTENNVNKVKEGRESSLDIETYIKRQQELKKRQEHKKSLGVSDYSKELAHKISKKNKNNAHSKQTKKRKYDSYDKLDSVPIHSQDKHQSDLTEKNRVVINNNIRDEDFDEKSGSEYVPSDGEFG